MADPEALSLASADEDEAAPLPHVEVSLLESRAVRPLMLQVETLDRAGYTARGEVVGQPGCRAWVSVDQGQFPTLAEDLARGPLALAFVGTQILWMEREPGDGRDPEAPES